MSVICSLHFHYDVQNTDLIPSYIPILVCFVSCISSAEGLLINITLRDICIILLPEIVNKGYYMYLIVYFDGCR